MLVSVIIPVYNGEKFIKETIESCLNQTAIEKIEILIIDDCSKDKSLQIIKAFESNRAIKIIENKENLGLMKSNNKAVSLAQGDYFLFLGHDDCLEPEHIEIMLSECDEQTAIVHCNSNLIDASGKVFGRGHHDIKQRIRNYFINYFLSLGNVIHSTGTLIQRRYFEQAGGWDERYKNYGEWLLWSRLACVGKVKYTTKVRALYRKHNTNITNTFTQPEVKKELDMYASVCKMEAMKCIGNPFILWWIKKVNHISGKKV